MTTTADPAATAAGVLAAARELAPRIRAAREAIEQDRRLPSPLVREMAEAGIFRALMPARLGGGEVDISTMVRIIEELSRADGAAGWCAMIGMGAGMISGFLPEETARAMIGADPLGVWGGATTPSGRAVAVPGGYRVSGRWAFGSGVEHCAWMGGNCLVFDDGQPRIGPGGGPEVRMALVPVGSFTIHDTWSVSGMRGSGSHDFSVADIFVPAERSYPFFTGRPVQTGPLFAFPLLGQLATSVAAVAVGLARAAIDALVTLAAAKAPTGQTNLLRERAAVQADVARAEALLRAGRAFLFAAIDDAWRTVAAGESVSLAQRAALRSAATHATRSAARAVDLMYNAGGATAIYTSSPLERCFRDIHVVTQHIMVAPATLQSAGRALLGLPVAPISL